MPDTWLLILIAVFGVILSAIYFVITIHSEENRKQKFNNLISKEYDDLIKSMEEFQRVAHDFPNNNIDTAKAGELFYCHSEDRFFIKTDDSYVRIAKENKSSNIPTNCKNCGAPLHGNKCEFCDTEYN